MKKVYLIERFVNGAESGTASRMKIWDIGGFRTIVGYGWAVYALDARDTLGEVLLFGDGYATDDTNVGWAGYSGTTTGHLQDIKGVLEATDTPYSVLNYRLKARTLKHGDVDLRQLKADWEVEPREGTGRNPSLA